MLTYADGEKVLQRNARDALKRGGSSFSIFDLFFLQVLVNDKTKTNENQRSARDGAYVETEGERDRERERRESQSVKKDEM